MTAPPASPSACRRCQERGRQAGPKGQWVNRKRCGSKGGRTTGFDSGICKRRNEVECTIDRLKNARAVATRYGKRVYVFRGAVTVAAIRSWLGP